MYMFAWLFRVSKCYKGRGILILSWEYQTREPAMDVINSLLVTYVRSHVVVKIATASMCSAQKFQYIFIVNT